MPSAHGRVICVADNYPRTTDTPVVPLAFLKDKRGSYGDGDVVRLPKSNERYWGEPELGFLIGKSGYRIPPDATFSHIDRFLIANDVTRESPAGHDHHLMYSKAFAGSLVVGPEINSNVQLGGATIRGYHNGVLLREGALADRIFDDASLISWISSWFRLEVGDMILTGAPKRVRDRQFLSEGDEFICAIDGVGQLANRFSFE